MMKAIVKGSPGRGLVMKRCPIPEITEKQVRIKIHTTAVCGTDLHIYTWNEWAEKNVSTPLIIGHEFMGHVESVGNGVTRCKVGDRVSGEGHLTCGMCSNCRNGLRHLCFHMKGVGYHVPGCFAEYLVLPEENVVVLPDAISDETGAILDPLGNAVHTALSFNLAGEDVLITGAGPLGLLAVCICRHVGARYIVCTDVNEYRLQLAKKSGATETVCVPKESIEQKTAPLEMEGGFSVGLEMSGNIDACRDLLQHLKPGGQAGLLGILPSKASIDLSQVIFKMLTIKGIYGRQIFRTWDTMIHLLQSGLDVHPLITHRFASDDYERAFQLLLNGQAAKVLLTWADSPIRRL